MTREEEEVEFQRELQALLAKVDRAVVPEAPDPYAGAGKQTLLEHTTRIYLLDGLVELLGWRLGLNGDMVEEARLKDGSTTYMDYLGVAPETRAPVLLIEAKAWDKPFITAEQKGANYSTSQELLAAAIDHCRMGGSAQHSPTTKAWHEYIDQVLGYVRGLKDNYGHPLPRAIITSGQWLVVFTKPVATFIDGPASVDDILIFKKAAYGERAKELHRLVSRRALSPETPYHIRPSQVLDYMSADALSACYHALHLSYDAVRRSIFERRPQILVHPALVLQRKDGTLFTVLEDINPLELLYDREVDELARALDPHLEKVSAAAADLLARTSELMGVELRPAPIAAFPGYPQTQGSQGVRAKSFIKGHPQDPDVWVLVTGEVAHFLRGTPSLECRFHAWAACREIGEAIGSSAISSQRTTFPRAFFVDDAPHHCAHKSLQDRRKERCKISLIDRSLCCQTCLYASECWSGVQNPALPCGN